jgi:ferric-chelate reductase
MVSVYQIPENNGRFTIHRIGGPGHRVFSSFSAAVVVAGGSGITFALSVIQDLIQKDLNAESRVKFLELIWIIQDPG